MNCLECAAVIVKRSNKYCSNQCQSDYLYRTYITSWKQGHVDGSRGLKAKNISEHIRRYMFEKYGNICSDCGWDKKHPLTGKVPLEIDHIDGNSENNKEDNLRLICPNCHALTMNFRNFNKGNGRRWRRSKYLKS